MTPKFIPLHRFRTGTLIMVNPRRVDTFTELPRPTQQQDLYCGTQVSFGRNETVIVVETVEDIKRLLK